MLTVNGLTVGIDGSNWQRAITPADIAAARAAGVQYGTFRLSLETPEKRALSVQQCQAFRAAGLPVMGYGWAYFDQDPWLLAGQYITLAAECGVTIVALDAEDRPSGDMLPWEWLFDACDKLHRSGILPLCYTYSAWPGSFAVALSPLGPVRWWMANQNFRADIDGYAPYPGANVVGHQYGLWTDPDGDTFDLNVFRFDSEMLAALGQPGGVDVTEDRVREIIREELDRVSLACGTPAGFALLQQAIVARIAAAGRALDLTQPIPELTVPGS